MKYIITEQQYRILNEEPEEILEIPFKVFSNDWNLLQEYLEAIGNPPYKIIDNLDLAWSNVKSLGSLISVDGYLNLYNTNIESLGNLKSVGGYLYLYGVNITSLGNLQSVGGDLYLGKSKIESLGNIQYVGGNLNLINTPLSEKTTENEIRNMPNLTIEGGIDL